jgi:putative hydrolase of the HAD superfamily
VGLSQRRSGAFDLPSNDERAPVFLFDLGGVLIKWHNNDPIYKYIAERYQVPFGELKLALAPNLPSVESGGASTEGFVKEGLSQLHRRLKPGDTGEELWLLPFAELVKLRLGVARTITRLREQGHRVYCLSNISPPHLEFIRSEGWADLFDRFFASCELGYVKPQPEIFEKVLKAIAASPDQVVFIDDSPVCIAGARAAGIDSAFRFQSISRMQKDIHRATRKRLDGCSSATQGDDPDMHGL